MHALVFNTKKNYNSRDLIEFHGIFTIRYLGNRILSSEERLIQVNHIFITEHYYSPRLTRIRIELI
jgi:hypothetical protein